MGDREGSGFPTRNFDWMEMNGPDVPVQRHPEKKGGHGGEKNVMRQVDVEPMKEETKNSQSKRSDVWEKEPEWRQTPAGGN